MFVSPVGMSFQQFSDGECGLDCEVAVAGIILCGDKGRVVVERCHSGLPWCPLWLFLVCLLFRCFVVHNKLKLSCGDNKQT